MIENGRKVYTLDKELLLTYDGYLARPCTVDIDTVADLEPNDDGRYIVPQGTYLTGKDGTSLLLDPNQIAKGVEVTETLATCKLGTDKITITAKMSGALTYKFDLEKGTGISFNPNIAYDSSTKTATITLAVDGNNDIVTTYGEVVNLINNDTVVNSLVTAVLEEDADPNEIALEEEVSTSGGGTESVTDAIIDGILYHSVDVTDGEATGAMIIRGNINIDSLDVEPGDAIKKLLPHIIFGRRD